MIVGHVITYSVRFQTDIPPIYTPAPTEIQSWTRGRLARMAIGVGGGGGGCTSIKVIFFPLTDQKPYIVMCASRTKCIPCSTTTSRRVQYTILYYYNDIVRVCVCVSARETTVMTRVQTAADAIFSRDRAIRGPSLHRRRSRKHGYYAHIRLL